jgi:hypothetical protein
MVTLSRSFRFLHNASLDPGAVTRLAGNSVTVTGILQHLRSPWRRSAAATGSTGGMQRGDEVTEIGNIFAEPSL